MVGLGQLCRQNGKRSSEVLDQVDLDVFAAVTDGCLSVQAADIPDAVGDLSAFYIGGGSAVDPLAEFPVADQQEAYPGDASPPLCDEIGQSECRTGLFQCIAPALVQRLAQIVGQATEDRVHLRSGETPDLRREVEIENDQVQRSCRFCRVAPIAVNPNSPGGGSVGNPVGRVEFTGFHQLFAGLLEEDILHELSVRIGLREHVLNKLASKLLNIHRFLRIWPEPGLSCRHESSRTGTARSHTARPPLPAGTSAG